MFSSVQSTWNLLETSAAPALADAHDAGFAVVVKEAFANGRLAPGSGETAGGVQEVLRIAVELGVGVDQLALAAALQQPWMPRVLSGAVTVAQVESHLTGTELDLPTDLMTGLAHVAEDPDEYWTARSRREWT